MSGRGLCVEYREGSSVHVRHTRLLAAQILVHESGGVLQEQDDLPVGVLQQARCVRVRYLAGERQSERQWPKQFDLSVLVRQTEHRRTVPAVFRVLRHTGATAAVRSEIAEASRNEIVHC